MAAGPPKTIILFLCFVFASFLVLTDVASGYEAQSGCNTPANLVSVITDIESTTAVRKEALFGPLAHTTDNGVFFSKDLIVALLITLDSARLREEAYLMVAAPETTGGTSVPLLLSEEIDFSMVMSALTGRSIREIRGLSIVRYSHSPVLSGPPPLHSTEHRTGVTGEGSRFCRHRQAPGEINSGVHRTERY